MSKLCRSLLIVLIGIAAVMRITACGDAKESVEPQVGIANPFVDYDTLQDACDAIGFGMDAPETIGEYNGVTFSVMKASEMIQIHYRKDENHYIVIRKARTQESIDGDYNLYEEDKTEEIDGREVRLKGNAGNVSLATWSDGEFSYSIGAYDLTEDGTGLSAKEMKDIISQVK